MNQLIKIFLILSCALLSTHAQLPTLEWAARYHKPHSDTRAMSVDNLGNIFLTGVYVPFNKSRFLTLKFNSSGVLQWSKTYQGPSTIVGYTDVAFKCIADGRGNVYVAGNSEDSANIYDIVIIKYNSLGDTIWTARYNSPSNSADLLSDMVMDRFANIYLACSPGITALKFDSTGNMLWERHYFPGNAVSIAIDSSHNVCVAGSSISGLWFQYTTVKLDSTGALQWARNYGTFDSDAEAASIAADRQGNVYVTGSVDSNSIANHSKIYTIKYDSEGNEIWSRSYKSLFFWMDIAYKVLLDSSGDPLISGTGLIKYNSAGNFLWADTMAGGNIIALDKEDCIYFASDTGIGGFDYNNFRYKQDHSYKVNISDIQTLIKVDKYDSNGAKLWSTTYGNAVQGGILRQSAGIIIDENNSIYVSANITTGQNDDSILVLKYSQPIGINGNSNQIPDKLKLHQNYPNPFNPKTRIKYQILNVGSQRKSNIKLLIYDVTGKEIETLIDKEHEPGTYEIEWNAENYASGVYFYSLKANDVIITRKMLLIK